MTCWGGNASAQDKNRLDKNMKKTGGWGGRGEGKKTLTQLVIDCHRHRLRTISADEARPLKPEFDNRQSKRQI